MPIRKYEMNTAAIKLKPVSKAFFRLFSSINIVAISKIKIANSQGLIASTAAPQTTATEVSLKVNEPILQTCSWDWTGVMLRKANNKNDNINILYFINYIIAHCLIFTKKARLMIKNELAA